MRISDWSSDVCSSDLIRSAFSGLSDAFEPMLEGALSVFGQVNDEALTLRDSIASLLGAVDDVRNIPRTLALKAGERFKEATGLTLPPSWLVGDSQASNLRGDRKGVVWGKSVSVSVGPGGRRIIQKKK